MTAPRTLTAIDLCCGAGGWACAARGLPIRVVCAVDLWDVCCRTYRTNHPGVDVRCADLRDAGVREQIATEFAGVDVVLGAIPCEWLSVRRNVSGGAKATPEAERRAERATLRAVLKLVRQLAPRYWCLEDVLGLRAELPASVRSTQIDSGHFSAQRRKRLYAGAFPLPSPPGNPVERFGQKLRPGPYRIGRRSADRRAVRARSFSATEVYSADVEDPRSPTICAFGSLRDSELVLLDSGLANGRRQMEWQEAASLQGFPEDFVFYGSPNDVWKQLGQAIQIDTGRAILEAIVQDAARKEVRA